MGIRDWFYSKKHDDSSISDNVAEGLSFDVSNASNKTLKDFAVKAVGYINQETYRRENFRRPEYNLLEIKEAAEADSYIKIAFSKYSYLLYKEGYQLKSENQEAIDYIAKRFKIMTLATGKPMEILFQEIGDDLVKYSNAFLIKSRTDKIPTVRATGILDEFPVGGYFRVDPTTIKIKRDKYGNVIKYEQGVGLNKKQFKPEDVIHMYYDKDANNSFGTPRIIAALDDVKLLRKIEGNVVALIHRFAMPLYQWKIGLPQEGFTATDTEIKKTKREVESSSLDSLIITNEKSEIKAIGAEGNALDAKPYLEYFENRAFSALELSASQMGRGGAKQDADSMEAQIHNTVKYIQRIMSIWIENTIINELLLEGGFDILNPNNEVRYVFNEISIETKIKKENHEMLKWQSNGITFEDLRRELGLRDTADEERLYDKMIKDDSSIKSIDRTGEWQIKLADVNAAHALQQAKVSATSSSSSSTSTKNKSGTSTTTKKARNTAGKKEPSKAVNNNNRPTNQHGTTSVKVKELEDYRKLILNASYKNIEVNALNAMNDSTVALNLITEDYKLIPKQGIDLQYFYDIINKKVDSVLQEAKENSNNNGDISFDGYLNELTDINNILSSMAYMYSYIKTSSLNERQEAYIQTGDVYSQINTDTFNYDDLFEYDILNSSVVYERGE